MDPTANLAEQLKIASKILCTNNATPEEIERLAELVSGLHWWISHKKGALPAQWTR